MHTKLLAMTAIVIVLCSGAPAHLIGQTAADIGSAQIRRDLERLAKSSNTKIEVKMKDGAKRQGFVTQKQDDSFGLTDAKSKQLANIPYSEVAKVKKPGWSTGAKVGLGAAIGAAAVTTVLLIAVKNADIGSGLCAIGCTR